MNSRIGQISKMTNDAFLSLFTIVSKDIKVSTNTTYIQTHLIMWGSMMKLYVAASHMTRTFILEYITYYIDIT